MIDLFRLGSNGIATANQLLQTSSNNIANVNTPGYVRERVEIGASPYGGVDRVDVERVVSEFAQKQVRRDTANASFYDQYLTEARRVDTLFAGSPNSVSTSLDTFFEHLQTAADDPTSIPARQLVIGQMESLLGNFNSLNELVLDQNGTINQQLDIYTNEANNLIESIAHLNKDIVALGIVTDNNPNALMSQRDEALRELSELVDISTIDNGNGETLVFSTTGQALVLKEGEFNFVSLNGDPDPQRQSLQLNLSANTNLTVPIEAEKVGGKIGGLLVFREEVLEPAQNSLGQLALAFTDAFNQQNRLGMDADGEIGSDIFSYPLVQGAAYNDNTGTSSVTATVEPGKGAELIANNILVTYQGPAVTIEALDYNGDVIAGSTVTLTPGSYPITLDSTNVPGGSLFGLSINLNPGLAAGDQFLLKPTAEAASSIDMLSNRPEDLAFASPIRTQSDSNNLGSGIITPGVVTDTDPASSNFTANHSLTTDPLYIQYDGNNIFSLYAANPVPTPGSPLTTVTFPSSVYEDVMATAGLPVSDYGYDFDIQGIPKTNDVFTVTYNTGGFYDNRNALLLADMQNQDLMRKNVVSGNNADNTLTFHEAYGSLVSRVGERTANAKSNEEAFSALLDQSTAWHESISGVNLDEEAANLVKFQQAYSAAARVISVAQSTFDTLLAAAR